MPWLQPRHMRRRTVIAALLVSAALSLAAHAADEAEDQPKEPSDAAPTPTDLVERVEVSSSVAKDREDSASFTDLDREEIAARHRGQDLGMLLAETPNAYAYSDAGNGVGYSYLSLRGFDQRRIAVNINGVPLNDPESHQVYFIDLADFAGSLQSLQVQRGTGTALYGSPAVGGAVNLETGALDREPQRPADAGRRLVRDVSRLARLEHADRRRARPSRRASPTSAATAIASRPGRGTRSGSSRSRGPASARSCACRRSAGRRRRSSPITACRSSTCAAR